MGFAVRSNMLRDGKPACHGARPLRSCPPPLPPGSRNPFSLRFLRGATKILQVALGRSESDEVRTNIHQLSERLKGNTGIFCTDMPKEEVGGKLGCENLRNW